MAKKKFFNFGEDVMKLEHLYIADGDVKIGTATLEISLAVSFKTKNRLDNLAFLCLSIYPRETKIYVHIETCIWIFIAALFVVASNWELPKYLSTDE